MICLPLGLPARIKDFPWFSLVIIATTVFCFFLTEKPQHNYTKYRVNLGAQQVTEWKLRVARSENCANSMLTGQECHLLAESIKGGAPQNIVQYFSHLRSLNNEQKLKASSIQRIIQYSTDPIDPDVAKSPAELEYINAKAESDPLLKAAQCAGNILTRSNVSLMALALAQVSHAGWMHLLGNLLVLLGFVVFVEQYLGAVKTAFIYLVGGSLGLLAQLPLLTDGNIQLLGASANVFAMGGAFLVLFWRKKIEVLISVMFVLNKRIHIPVWTYFLAFLLLREWAGAIDHKSTNVAHLAHLSGLFVGMGLTWLMIRKERLHHQFTFPYEAQEFVALNSAETPSTRLNIILRLLFFNHLNGMALEALAKEVSKAGVSWGDFSPAARTLIQQSIAGQIEVLIDSGDMNELADLLKILPRSWPLNEIIPALSPYRRIKYQEAIQQSERRADLDLILSARGA